MNLALLRGAKALPLMAALLCAALLLLLFAGLAGQSPSGAATAEETRIAAALSQVAGAGEVRVVIGEGVLIVAEGADDLRVSLALSRAVETLLTVPPARIEVLPMR